MPAAILSSTVAGMTKAALPTGFAPLARSDARVLVLGSLPGIPSLRAGQYYANPRNAFWRIMQDLLQIPLNRPYAERTAQLIARRVALWDVLHSSPRAGSLDTAIRREHAVANDFEAFLGRHRQLRLIAFNGRTAAQLFAALELDEGAAEVPPQVCLPSTSPAYAAMAYADKCRRWAVVKTALDD